MGWVFDLDGVIWLGDQPIPGAAEAVARVRARTEAVLFVTNNSFHPLETYEDKLARMGIPARGRVVSSATVAAELVEPGERVLVCGGLGIVQAVEARGAVIVAEGAADAVVVGYNPMFDYESLSRTADAVRDGARFVATNDDATYPTPEGPRPGGGALVAAVATAAGREPLVAGKPHAPAARAVGDRLGPSGVVVGDRPETDGRFARALGYEFALVLSGVTKGDDLPVEPTPTAVGADVGDLVNRWPWPD